MRWSAGRTATTASGLSSQTRAVASIREGAVFLAAARPRNSPRAFGEEPAEGARLGGVRDHEDPSGEKRPDPRTVSSIIGLGPAIGRNCFGLVRAAERPKPRAPAAGQDDGPEVDAGLALWDSRHAAAPASRWPSRDAPDLVLNGVQVRLGLGLEAQDQDGLGVGGPDEAPALRKDGPHAVDVDDRIFCRRAPALTSSTILNLTSSEA